jgi:hypothetical protein
MRSHPGDQQELRWSQQINGTTGAAFWPGPAAESPQGGKSWSRYHLPDHTMASGGCSMQGLDASVT